MSNIGNCAGGEHLGLFRNTHGADAGHRQKWNMWEKCASVLFQMATSRTRPAFFQIKLFFRVWVFVGPKLIAQLAINWFGM